MTEKELQELQEIVNIIEIPTENFTEVELELDYDIVTKLKQLAEKLNTSEEKVILAIITQELDKREN